MMQYIKPRSVTWWASMVPLVAGLVVASEPIHGWGAVVSTINNMTGGIAPAILIANGLVGIGLRKAVG